MDWPFLGVTVLVWVLWPLEVVGRLAWRALCLAALVAGGWRR